ncbi:hypothetical protein A5680_21625 [Mycobacterium sp. E2989]|nr:hypothetical protein A5680_21625 [Mycobacterium sp. E2989]
MYQSARAGGGVHVRVAGLNDMFGSQSAELIPGVTITVTAVATNAIAMTAIRRAINHLMVCLPMGHRDPGGFSLFR